MKIKEIQPFIVSQKLKRPFYFSQWDYDTRTVCIVKVITDEGIYGWGEGYGPAHIIKSGIEWLIPFILDMDAMQHENIWQTLYLRSLDYARRGILVAAISAIDVALWDIKGKALNLPVSTLLGGRKRDNVIPYATGMYFSKFEDLKSVLAEEAIMYKEQGYKAMKMKVGLGIESDIANVAAVREAIGRDIALMVDSNHAFSVKEATTLASKMEDFNIDWFEEPISPEEYDHYHYLRTRTSIPIAAGECEYLRYGFLEIFKKGAVDIAQPDICAAGGITEAKKIVTMAQTFGVEIVPHTWGTGIAIAAALHLIANLDMVPGRMNEPRAYLELDRTENALRDELVYPEFVPEAGQLSVPDNPGLGIDVDEKMLKKYVL